MRSFAPAALRPDAATEQHDLRIAAKRLRYVLEVTGFCFGRPADTARRHARDIQGVLGELHDCDVMLPRVAAQVERIRGDDARAIRARAGDANDLDPALVARAPHRTAYRGLELLAVHVEARRALLFDRFVGLWTELERAGTWERLEQAIERKRRESRERRAAAGQAGA
jgi:CHAD domain-containing protein